jgi:hypothetical protein
MSPEKFSSFTVGDKLMFYFTKFAEFDSPFADRKAFQPYVNAIKELIDFDEPITSTQTQTIDQMSFFMYSSIFYKKCLPAMRDSKHFKECFARPNFDIERFHSVFLIDLIDKEVSDKSDAEFWVYWYMFRFLMDVYTICRIMKQDRDPRRYKDIIIYAGDGHRKNCTQMLALYGYEITEVDTVKYNPKCLQYIEDEYIERVRSTRLKGGKTKRRMKKKGKKSRRNC